MNLLWFFKMLVALCWQFGMRWCGSNFPNYRCPTTEATGPQKSTKRLQNKIRTRADKNRNRPDSILNQCQQEAVESDIGQIGAWSVPRQSGIKMYLSTLRPDRCMKGPKTESYKNVLIPNSSKSVLKRPKTELYKNVFMPNSSRWRFEAISTRRDKKRQLQIFSVEI